MKKLLFLGIIGLVLSTNACSKADTYNYNVEWEYGNTYTQWFRWQSIVSYYDAGDIVSIDGKVRCRIRKSWGMAPDKSENGTGASGQEIYEPHYELVAQFKVRYSDLITYDELQLVSEWKYAYGQFELIEGCHIFRIFELYDEIPE